MDALTAAASTAAAISSIGSHFMLDGNTYKRGAELGFGGLDFYVAGRGGVLGDVDADVVAASFTFFEPNGLRTLWEQGRSVMPAAAAAVEFAACCATWAETHVPDDLDAARLAELAGAVVTSARSACAPVFAGWRALTVPAEPKGAAVHHLNALRELRNGLHGAAVVSVGLSPLEALSLKTPQMLALFGWATPADCEGLQPKWDRAEEQTTAAMAYAYDALDDGQRTELVELTNSLHEATKG